MKQNWDFFEDGFDGGGGVDHDQSVVVVLNKHFHQELKACEELKSDDKKVVNVRVVVVMMGLKLDLGYDLGLYFDLGLCFD